MPKYLFLFSAATSGYHFEQAFFADDVFKSIVSNNSYEYQTYINTSTLNQNTLSWYSPYDATIQANTGYVGYICFG